MDRKSIEEFLKELSSNRNIAIEHRGDWISTHCPIAKWTHDKGTDNRISFGVLVKEEGTSIFQCFSCHKKGTLVYLTELMEKYTGRSYSNLRQMAEDSDVLGVYVPEWGRRSNRDESEMEPIDENYIELFDSAVGHPYLHARGVEDDTISLLNLRIDPDNKGVERILFPVYGLDHKLYGFTGRATSDIKLKVRDYFGLVKAKSLLGCHLIDLNKHKYTILVEGLMDYAKLVQYGYPAVSVMGSTISEGQKDILLKIGLPIITFFDDDKAGHECTIHAVKVLGKHLPLTNVSYPKEYRNEYSGLDPCDLYKEEVDYMIENRVCI